MVCKDTDELYIERLPVDPAEGEALLLKAARVIEAVRPPEKQTTDPAWPCKCRLCGRHALCHGGGEAERNCRTCLHSTPIEGGWSCARHDRTLSAADQRKGCDRHLYIPDLVAGEQVDAGEDWVEYRMPDGKMIIDGRKE